MRFIAQALYPGRHVVFRSTKQEPAEPAHSFAPFDYLNEEDELVYSVPIEEIKKRPGGTLSQPPDTESRPGGTLSQPPDADSRPGGTLSQPPDGCAQARLPPERVWSRLQIAPSGSPQTHPANRDINSQNSNKNVEKPALRITRELGGRRTLLLEGYVAGTYAMCLVDSGASCSFVSKDWCERSHQKYTSRSLQGVVADGSPLNIAGQLSNAWLKLGAFREEEISWLLIFLDTT
jgi:hypothetical protein